jgi:hypothetical protein
VIISKVYDALREVVLGIEGAPRGRGLGREGAPRSRGGGSGPRLTAIETRLNALDSRLAGVESRLNFMQWQIGIVAALQIAALVKLFVH